jgi:hypothetical protein
MKRFCATFLMLAALLAVSSLAYGDKGLRLEATLSGAQEVTTDPPGGEARGQLLEKK